MDILAVLYILKMNMSFENKNILFVFFDAAKKILFVRSLHICLQCFDTVGWAPGKASGL